MTDKLPPRWFIRSAWVAHRALYRVSRGRIGLARPREGGRFGMLRLHAIGRRSGEERVVILGYYEDGLNLVICAPDVPCGAATQTAAQSAAHLRDTIMMYEFRRLQVDSVLLQTWLARVRG